MQSIDTTLGIIVQFILFILTTIFGIISVRASQNSRKYAAIVKNAVSFLDSVGVVMAALYEGRACLWDIQYAVEKSDSEKWKEGMRGKRIQASILVANAGPCTQFSYRVLKVGETMFSLNTNLVDDFDRSGHSELLLEIGSLLRDLRAKQKQLVKISEGVFDQLENIENEIDEEVI